MVACAAVISIRIYQQPDTTQFAVQSTPVPTRSPEQTQKELDFPPPVLIPPFETQSRLFSLQIAGIFGCVHCCPADPLRSNEFIPLKLEWRSPRRSATAREIKVPTEKTDGARACACV